MHCEYEQTISEKWLIESITSLLSIVFLDFPAKNKKTRSVNNKLQTGILGISLFGKPGNYLAGNKFRDF